MADAFESAVLRLLAKIGPGESISPAEAAREASQETGVEWEQLLKAIRGAAVKLALEGRAVILLKGEAVDPEHFRGIYRVGGGDYFTPRKAAPAYTPPPLPLAPARDYTPAPRPYTPPAPSQPAPQEPQRAAPASPPTPVRLAVRVNTPAARPPPPAPSAVVVPLPSRPALPPPAVLPPPEEAEPVPHPRLEPRYPAFEEASFEDESEEAPAAAEPQWAIDEGTPVTRFEFEPRSLDEDDGADEPDFLEEAHADEASAPTSQQPLPAPALSFDDEDDGYDDEDAQRAPQSATLDDIASQLERYLAAELDHPARGNAEIGDDVVRLPRQQDE
jgi:hypothetical protein